MVPKQQTVKVPSGFPAEPSLLLPGAGVEGFTTVAKSFRADL